MNMILKVFILISASMLVAICLPGCSSISYYSHLMNGHHALTEAEEDIEDILSENRYDAEIRARLAKALEIRRFASERLDLPDNDSYKTFVKLNRPFPVWNVVAAERFSVKARTWCFLVVGCINYRGYFNEQDAREKAKELATEGYDVSVSPVAAYSTLGWFDDPLLSSMLYKEEAHLAGIIFHELAHQKVYIDDDSAFNEAFATAVELEGVRRWLTAHQDSKGIENYRLYKQRQHEFNKLLQATREQLKQLYKTSQPPADKLSAKTRIIVQMKERYQDLKKGWQGYSGYDKWMQRDINNAHLALVATYHERVPAFLALLRQQDNDLQKFYLAAAKIGHLPEPERDKRLDGLTQSALALESDFK